MRAVASSREDYDFSGVSAECGRDKLEPEISLPPLVSGANRDCQQVSLPEDRLPSRSGLSVAALPGEEISLH